MTRNQDPGVDSHSNSGSYGSGRQPDPYSPHTQSSQQGSYRVNNAPPPQHDGAGYRNSAMQDPRQMPDPYRQDPPSRQDSYSRGTMSRDGRLASQPRDGAGATLDRRYAGANNQRGYGGDGRSVSPSNSAQYSTSRPPSVLPTRADGGGGGVGGAGPYAHSQQAPYRQTPQLDQRGHALNDPRQQRHPAEHPYQSAAPDRRPPSSERLQSLPRDANTGGYPSGTAPLRKRPQDEGYGTMDILGQGQNSQLRSNQPNSVGYNPGQSSSNSMSRDPRTAPPPHQQQQAPQRYPPSSHDPYRSSADARNMDTRYPRDSNTDLYSERSIDVRRPGSDKPRDDDSVSDDGGFKSRSRPAQNQWSSPDDLRSVENV